MTKRRKAKAQGAALPGNEAQNHEAAQPASQSAQVAAPTSPAVDDQFEKQLRGFSLTTAEILYRLPDHPSLLQTYVWQDYDLHPRFPRLKEFLDFWSSNLDGALYKVLVAHRGLIGPRELRLVSGEFKLH